MKLNTNVKIHLIQLILIFLHIFGGDTFLKKMKFSLILELCQEEIMFSFQLYLDFVFFKIRFHLIVTIFERKFIVASLLFYVDLK